MATKNVYDKIIYVASHNIMDGLYLNKLLQHYHALKDKAKGLPIFLCIQENVIYDANRVMESTTDTTTFNNKNNNCKLHSSAAVISNELSTSLSTKYENITSSDTRLSTIYDSNTFELIESKTLYLPKLEKLSILNRMAGFEIQDKTSLLTRFKLRNQGNINNNNNNNVNQQVMDNKKEEKEDDDNLKHNDKMGHSNNNNNNNDNQYLTIINFHLDAAGDNKHRTMQFQEMANNLNENESFVLCGDTNLFTFFPQTNQYHLLNEMIKPIASKCGAGIIGDCTEPTHFFSRANEPKFGHQVVYQLGKFGFDIPGCYDILISNMKEETFGQIDTPFSDHNLVYAKFRL